MLAGKITWEKRHDAEELVHNLAVCLWLCANVVWMIGEFFFDDGTRAIARVFFFAGLILLGGPVLGALTGDGGAFAAFSGFAAVLGLPTLHTDPFDLLLIAQSQVEGIPILTDDAQIQRFPIETIW